MADLRVHARGIVFVFLFFDSTSDLGDLVFMPFGDIEIIFDKGADGRDEASFHLLQFIDGKLRHETEIVNPLLPPVYALIECMEAKQHRVNEFQPIAILFGRNFLHGF